MIHMNKYVCKFIYSVMKFINVLLVHGFKYCIVLFIFVMYNLVNTSIFWKKVNILK